MKKILVVPLMAIVFSYAPALLADEKTVYECDLLAAHPHDPQRVAAGVYGYMMDELKAAEVCKRDLLNNPKVARLAYQYGRALNYLGQCQEAKYQYLVAIQKKHYWGLYSLSTWSNYYDGVYDMGKCQSKKPSARMVADLLDYYIKMNGENRIVLKELCHAYRSENDKKAERYCK